jgi:hypothetical protein
MYPSGGFSLLAFDQAKLDVAMQASDLMVGPMLSLRGVEFDRVALIKAMDGVIFGNKSIFGVLELAEKFHTDGREMLEACDKDMFRPQNFVAVPDP